MQVAGTSRVLTTSTGTVCYDADFYPFGGERSYTNTCLQNYKFEGKERDAETGNDDFGARYYSNRFGRWLSADWSSVPVPVPYANLTNPQTLNLYSMVADDPESFADLDGHGPNDPPSSAAPPAWCPNANGGGPCTGATSAQENRPTGSNNQAAQQQTAQAMEAAFSAGASSSSEAGVNKALMNILLSFANAGMNGGVVSRETLAPLQGNNRDEKAAMIGTDLTIGIASLLSKLVESWSPTSPE